jgi:ubiquinone/menaquinone biosynthesis C-methylase UbiE
MRMNAPFEAAQAHYDRLAADYDQRWANYLRLSVDAIVEVLPRDPAARILDMPCGTGQLGRRLTAQGSDALLVGGDLSRGMLEEAARKCPSPLVTWLQCDVRQLPFADNVFDHVVCASSLHYFRSPEESLRELHRVLRPGGMLILIDWCGDFLSCRLIGLWLRLTQPAVVKVYASDECRRLLESASFSIADVDRFRVDWAWKLMRFVCRKS